jgi:hypothetical protein
MDQAAVRRQQSPQLAQLHLQNRYFETMRVGEKVVKIPDFRLVSKEVVVLDVTALCTSCKAVFSGGGIFSALVVLGVVCTFVAVEVLRSFDFFVTEVEHFASLHRVSLSSSNIESSSGNGIVEGV